MKILKFYGDWCGPCKVLSKTLQSLNINVEEINVDSNEELVSKYHISSVPVLIKLDSEGKEIARLVGNKSKDQIEEFCK